MVVLHRIPFGVLLDAQPHPALRKPVLRLTAPHTIIITSGLAYQTDTIICLPGRYIRCARVLVPNHPLSCPGSPLYTLNPSVLARLRTRHQETF